MSDLGNYQVSFSKPFLASYKELKEGHYGKNQRGIAALEELVESFVRLLGIEPRPPLEKARSYNDAIKEIVQQKFNSIEYLSQWDFRKLHFVCPELRRRASMGRLMYVIDNSRGIVYLVLIYTHQKYEDRPPDSIMNETFKQLKRDEYG